MCGIVGYVGERDILSVLIVGLERLSYRGYDSAGIAVVSDDEISVWKRPGKVHVLAKELELKSIDSAVGIGHTRWAIRMVFQMKSMRILILMPSVDFLLFTMALSKITCN